jgi:hypothetical protein
MVLNGSENIHKFVFQPINPMTVKKKNGNDPKNGFLGILVTLIKEVGTLSFVVVMVTYVFIVFSTVEQKKEFIDKFFF